MTTEILLNASSSMFCADSNGTEKIDQYRQNNNKKTDNTSSQKSTAIFEETISKTVEEKKNVESDYYVKEIMNQKNVSQEVAQAEYDFFS